MPGIHFAKSMAILACLTIAAIGVAADPANTTQKATTSAQPATQAKTPHSESVTFAVGGAEDTRSADILTKALRNHGLYATVQPEHGRPFEFNVTLPRSMDLGWYSKAITSASTPQKGTAPPTFDFVLFAPLTKDSAQQALDHLAHLKGIDVKNSRADIEHGKLWIRIDGTSHVTPDDIYNAVHSAGIVARFSQFTSNTG